MLCAFMNERVRFVIIGAGKRSDYLYAPLLNILNVVQARLAQELTLTMNESANHSEATIKLPLQQVS